jgi:glycyl-tRNA synthetase beta chain
MRKATMRDFLVEIHTEELPPNALKSLASHFLQEIQMRLNKAELKYHSARSFVTPRRLAVQVTKLAGQQPDSIVERKGPALTAAFNAEGGPTPACIGFARSCGVTPQQLVTIKTAQGEWVGFLQPVTGQSVQALLPTIIQQAIAALPAPKRMRWGHHTAEFLRPVHSIIMLYGNDIVPANILGLQSGRKTRGHRFHSKGWIDIANARRYLKTLEKKYVLAGFEERKEKIRALTMQAVKQLAEATHQDLFAQINDALLEEVTGLVEWPVALCGHFDDHFLSVPQEALISAMQDHQRYFPIVNKEGQLQPYFVTISNIESKDPKQVIAGNERVLRARLSDAQFFFDMDLKQTLSSRVDDLKQIVYQHALGTLFDKAERLSHLAEKIAQQLGADSTNAKQAGLLAKADLTTQLVGEFPELQGIAGRYYAYHENIPADICDALREQYLPRFSGDLLPSTLTGCAVALADRLDTLVGVFGMNHIPTGDKDPFGLRRAALGLLRILIEKQLPLDCRDLLQMTLECYVIPFENPMLIDHVLHFILERLRPWYQEQSISMDVYAAVAALHITTPYDFHCRIQAVQAFKCLPEAHALSRANKRVSNILSQYNGAIEGQVIHSDLFEEEAERLLAEKLGEKRDEVMALSASKKYAAILTTLAALRGPVDDFFDNVLVMTEERARRENRLLLLKQLRELFLYVADIALLQ